MDGIDLHFFSAAVCGFVSPSLPSSILSSFAVMIHGGPCMVYIYTGIPYTVYIYTIYHKNKHGFCKKGNPYFYLHIVL